MSETKQNYYNQAILALSKGDTAKAIDNYKDSGKYENNAEAYFRLAEIYSRDKSHTELTKALQAVRKATEIDKKNIKYRLLMAKTREELFYASRLNIDERNTAIDDYARIIEIDSNCYDALYNLGRLYSEDFEEYFYSESIDKNTLDEIKKSLEISKERYQSSIFYSHRAARLRNMKDTYATLKYRELADNYFKNSEMNLLKAIRNSPSSIKPYIYISRIYILNGFPEKIIPLLNSYLEIDSSSKEVHIFLGMAYYMTKNNEAANKEFNVALALMNNEEKEDFTINSVKKLLKPKLGESLDDITKYEMLRTARMFWNINDPLNLTSYNERLLEHYSRIAYSILFFQPKDKEVSGWKTDRGETLLRYGMPSNVIRYRPQSTNSEYNRNVSFSKPVVNHQSAKTEMWFYPDNLFVFQDLFWSDNFQFADNTYSQIPFDTQNFMNDYRVKSLHEYTPSFEGPVFELPYNTYQFKSLSENMTDIYISYKINLADSNSSYDKFEKGYKYGLFFYDRMFNKIFEDKDEVKSISNNPNFSNNLKMTLPVAEGNLSFEILRNKDKGVASYHGKYKVEDYNKTDLKLSSLVLANQIVEESNQQVSIKRKNISIQPSISNVFSNKDNINLYFEVYNLGANKEKLTDFEQKITIQKKEEDNTLSDILDVVGLGSKGEKISTTSNYQTFEPDPQIYFQLDLSDYETGEYLLTLSITDKINKSTSTTTASLFLIE